MWKVADTLRKVAPYMSLGAMFAGCMVAGVLGGWWLDKRLGTSPWLLLAGALFGMGAGFYHFFKVVLHMEKMRTPAEHPVKGDGSDDSDAE